MTNASCSVRPAGASDIARIIELYDELDDVHRRSHPELYRSEKFVRDPIGLENALRDSGVGLLVADAFFDASPAVVGFVRVVDVQTPDGRVLAPRRFGLVDDLVVTASHRRTGVGGELLRAAEVWARTRGLEALEVTVWAFNSAAQSLYDRHGFALLRHYFRKTL